MTTATTFEARKIRHVFTDGDLQAFLGAMSLRAGETLVFDLETTSLNEWLPYSRVACATFTFAEEVNYCIPLSHPDSPFKGRWKTVLQRIALCMRECLWVGQNLPFDVRWIYAMTGIDLSDRVATDTMLGSHLLDDLSTTSLKPRAAKIFGIEQWNDFDFKWIEREQDKDPLIHLVRCPRLSERVPYLQLALYATADTYWTWRLLEYQRHKLMQDPARRRSLENDPDITEDDRELLRLGRYKEAIGDKAVGSLARMSINGMMVDRGWCASRLTENEGVILQREEELFNLVEDPFAGVDREGMSYNPNSLWFKNWARQMVSEKKLREVGVTEKGDVSWAESCLKRNHKLGMVAAEPLMDLRTRTTENQFLRVWLSNSEIDDRIHANFNFARTRTGRLSSSEPNLQQVSRVMKDAFLAAPGKILVSADYSQIELRVAAWLANIEPVLDAYRAGIDLHSLMAASTAGVDLDDVTKLQRQQAKAVNFGFLFGMGAPKFVTYAEDSYDVTFTFEEAEKVRMDFFDMWVGLSDWHEEQRVEVRQTGQVVCPLGRVRRLPDGQSKNKYWRGMAERQAINTPVQSTASDMMLVAVNEINRYGWIKIVAIVHDAVIVEVDERRGVEAASIVKDVMEIFVPVYLEKHLGVTLTVPLVADTSYGKSWGTQTALAV